MQRNKIFSLIILVTIFTIISCGNSKTENTETQYFDVYFIQKGTTIPISMGCINEIKDKNIFFQVINNDVFSTNFNKVLKSLTISKTKKNVDVRITVYSKFKNKKTDTICFGENNGIVLNGITMNDSDELLRLLKNEINYETTFKSLEEVLDSK